MTARTLQQQRYDERRARKAEPRAARIANLIDAGRTYAEVAARFRISRGRVYQIMRRYDPTRFLNWRDE